MREIVKALFLTFILCITTNSVFAQNTFVYEKHDSYKGHENEKRFFLGGAASFWADPKNRSITLDFCPEVGYLFNDTWGIGMLLGYEYQSGYTEGVKNIGQSFKISPILRYYYFHRKPFNLYLDAGGGVNFSINKDGNVTNHLNGFEVGLRPGACVDLTEGLCLCLRMGFVGYRNDYFMGEEPQLGTNGFGFRFAPEDLMIGLELEI